MPCSKINVPSLHQHLPLARREAPDKGVRGSTSQRREVVGHVRLAPSGPPGSVPIGTRNRFNESSLLLTLKVPEHLSFIKKCEPSSFLLPRILSGWMWGLARQRGSRSRPGRGRPPHTCRPHLSFTNTCTPRAPAFARLRDACPQYKYQLF